ncbi:threonine-phosphate decarboxylase CobD [Acetobacter lambici]|uniref:threonine-phosphate decarboxylase n=1 Tax=Acetobacter lambici TaxID=1332824 RepID=A0ABT1F2D3_9PROT|nr:threonine-phosphate decarboxylase CobD [Acetobacter lambici]MCP1242989.1 threonine-phosphate decarboxylase CobD [Acetobacter lambici]MCP1259141.1 threonine-phosphate decarboxylase CobD [Acetobacter lambici]
MNTRLTQKITDATMHDGMPPNALSSLTGVPHVPLPSHGGQVQAIMRYFAGAPEPFIDLSTGVSPFAYPLVWPDPNVLHHLPEEGEEQALQQVAAHAYGVPTPDMVVIGAGSQSLIALLPRLLPVRQACVLGPTYSGHRLAWEHNGVPCADVEHVQQINHAAQQAGTVCVICNPNNPDGRLLDVQTLAALAERCAQAGSWLVVDEAFGDFSTQSVASLLPHPGLVVLRSFGKTYGLPGVRLGFLLAVSELAQKARAMLGAWPVGALALAVGGQALADTQWLRQAAQKAQMAHDRLTGMLRKAGLACRGHSTLFTLVDLAHAYGLWAHLCGYGIVTRRFADRPHCLRIGLPANEAAWNRLECALKAWQTLHHSA